MKVLIVSHNCFSKTQNMGKTLTALFSEFKKEEICQLYFYPSVPSLDVCDSYYRITDKDILFSILKRRNCGKQIEPICDDSKERIYESDSIAMQYKKGKSVFIRRMRDVLWSFGAWKNSTLKEWLVEEKPDVVFYALGDATFSQNIAMWISRFLKIPLVTYVCDEYYFSLKGLINRGLVKNIGKTIKKSKCIVSICEALGEIYQKRFGVLYTTVMTGSSFDVGDLEKKENGKEIAYIGNLSLNRWKSLLDVAEVINELNLENKGEYKLVYYGGKREELEGKIEYGGMLDADGVKKTMEKSLLLVHVETFDEEYRARLMYSVSTKIADSLASGTGILAYGPSELVSMQHLIKNGCCVFGQSKEELKLDLKNFFENNMKREELSYRAKKTAISSHSRENNSKRLYQVMKDIAFN